MYSVNCGATNGSRANHVEAQIASHLWVERLDSSSPSHRCLLLMLLARASHVNIFFRSRYIGRLADEQSNQQALSLIALLHVAVYIHPPLSHSTSPVQDVHLRKKHQRYSDTLQEGLGLWSILLLQLRQVHAWRSEERGQAPGWLWWHRH